jgi:hypothetical protein
MGDCEVQELGVGEDVLEPSSERVDGGRDGGTRRLERRLSERCPAAVLRGPLDGSYPVLATT